MKNLHSTMILLFSISLHCLQLVTTAAALSNETDRLALLKFKESINDDPHGILRSWNNSIHFCNWDGIKCSGRHQRVTALELSERNLRGTISPFIGNLSFLRFFNLEANRFHGKIPQEVGHLFRLQHLSISNNALEGEILINLINCSNLRIMNVSVNKFSGKIPEELGSFVKLERLQLAINNLTGRIPPSLGNLSSLQFFSAAYNDLVGNIPEDIGRLKSLSFFSLGANRLSGMIPSSIYNISSITIFTMPQNEFQGTLPANIGLTLPNLQKFAIGGNNFSGPIPISLANASHLQILDIGGNNFVGQVPTNLGNLIDLHQLVFSNNNLGSYSAKDLDFIRFLKNCSQLEVMDLSTNQFGGVLPNSIANLSTQLRELYFGGNQISGIIPAIFENFINLTILAMEDNLFEGIIPPYFGKFQKMQLMGLDYNNLSGAIPSSIGNLTQLVKLTLSQNKLEGSIPPSIGKCQSMQKLDMSHNNLSGAIPQQVIGLSSLLQLNLSYNSLSGTLSAEVENLKNIYTLDVSENNLSGEVPRAIENCMSLEYLYLQCNSFQGAIPPSLASLKGLQHLDLSRNNLSGQIPKDLNKLRFLLYLNLSFNNLEGEVPMEGVFLNASAILVTRNHKLCGGIPELQLPACPDKVRRKSHRAFKLTIIIVSVVLSFLLILSFLALYWMRKSKKKLSSTFSTMDLLPKVSYKSLYLATSGFSSSNLIGSGSFGSVYKGILGEEDKVVAIKVLNLQQKGASKSFMAECNALRTIRHRNLVKILTCCSSMDYNRNEFKALVFEFMTNESLDKWLCRENDSEIRGRNLNLLQRLNIAIDIACALDYLHHHSERPIIHCDLKPSNVLLDNDMVAHVSDFGLARLLSTNNDSSQKQTSTIGLKGSIGYAAPEYGMGGEPSTEGDVYSYGILVLEMFTRRRPTDEMFKDGLNLYNFTKMSLPERLVQIVDPTLLTREVEETTETVATMRGARAAPNNIDNEIGADEETNNIENLRQMNPNVHKCLLSLLEVGLACSVESPKERMNMGEVTKQLDLIKNVFLVSGIRRNRPNRTQVRGA